MSLRCPDFVSAWLQKWQTQRLLAVLRKWVAWVAITFEFLIIVIFLGFALFRFGFVTRFPSVEESTSVLAIATFILGFATLLLWFESRSQAKFLAKQFEAANRPWLIVDISPGSMVQWSDPPKSPRYPKPYPYKFEIGRGDRKPGPLEVKNAAFDISISVKNVGTTPAIGVYAVANVEMTGMLLAGEELEYAGQTEPQHSAGGVTIFRDKTETLAIQLQTNSGEIGFEDGEGIIFVVKGYVGYWSPYRGKWNAPYKYAFIAYVRKKFFKQTKVAPEAEWEEVEDRGPLPNVPFGHTVGKDDLRVEMVSTFAD